MRIVLRTIERNEKRRSVDRLSWGVACNPSISAGCRPNAPRQRIATPTSRR